MSSENTPPTSGPLGIQSTGDRKGAGTTDPPLPCPRCNSSNTKFCYYNNYSLSQPRHFCKSCRRYWTRGGALRNVPVGGGCRKSKKFKPCSPSTNTSTTITTTRLDSISDGFGFKLTSSSDHPSMEFQLGGLSLPRLHPATADVYTQFIANANSVSGSGSGFGLDLFGMSHPAPPTATTTTMTPISVSTIESLSSINQEMHSKLQQQRLGLIYGGGDQKEMKTNVINNNTSGDNDDNMGPTEWFIDQATGYIPCTTSNQVVGGGFSGVQPVAASASAAMATATTTRGIGGSSWSDFQFIGFH